MVGEAPVSPHAIANYRMTNQGRCAEFGHHALQGELPAGTDCILERRGAD
jgi:hypothetical protein